MSDIRPGRAGVRALLLSQNGDTKDDFRIEYSSNSIHVLNAPSPAATACLAIGNEIKEMAIKNLIELINKQFYFFQKLFPSPICNFQLKCQFFLEKLG